MKEIAKTFGFEVKENFYELSEEVAQATTGGCVWFSYSGPIKYNGYKFW